VGGPGGGLAFGLRDFWQRHPTQLDVRDAHTDTAQVRLWWHSPAAPALDLRPYHDGLGQDSFEKPQPKGGFAKHDAAFRGQRLSGELRVMAQVGLVHRPDDRQILIEQAHRSQGSEEVNHFRQRLFQGLSPRPALAGRRPEHEQEEAAVVADA